MGLRRFGGPGMHGIGGVPLSSMGGGALGTYAGKLLGYSPIAYWPMWETSGVTAQCLVNSLQNGTYNGPTLANAAAPDGSPCPLFDGLNDQLNVFTATLAAALDGDEGTAMQWLKVTNVGIWTDGVNRRGFHIVDATDSNEYVQLAKININNTLRWRYCAGGVLETVHDFAVTTTDWFHMAITWSASAGVNGEVKAYLNGAQDGATQTALGVWVGNITSATIGCENGPANYWAGWIAHTAIFGRALAQSEIANLARV